MRSPGAGQRMFDAVILRRLNVPGKSHLLPCPFTGGRPAGRLSVEGRNAGPMNLHSLRPLLMRALSFAAMLLLASRAGAAVNHATIQIYSAYPAKAAGQQRVQMGYNGVSSGTPVYPGVLHITPGTNWSNYLGVAGDGVPYTLSTAILKRIRPPQSACAAAFPSNTVTQESAIRLRWPLLYEPTGTRWELTIVYFTSSLYDDDGAGPDPPAYIHTEKWTWLLASDCRHLLLFLQLLRETDVTATGSPALSDSAAAQLMSLAGQALAASQFGDTVTEKSLLQQTSQIAGSDCAGGGLAETAEHPACCKLQTELAYILSQLPPAQESQRKP